MVSSVNEWSGLSKGTPLSFASLSTERSPRRNPRDARNWRKNKTHTHENSVKLGKTRFCCCGCVVLFLRRSAETNEKKPKTAKKKHFSLFLGSAVLRMSGDRSQTNSTHTHTPCPAPPSHPITKKKNKKKKTSENKKKSEKNWKFQSRNKKPAVQRFFLFWLAFHHIYIYINIYKYKEKRSESWSRWKIFLVSFLCFFLFQFCECNRKMGFKRRRRRSSSWTHPFSDPWSLWRILGRVPWNLWESLGSASSERCRCGCAAAGPRWPPDRLRQPGLSPFKKKKEKKNPVKTR